MGPRPRRWARLWGYTAMVNIVSIPGKGDGVVSIAGWLRSQAERHLDAENFDQAIKCFERLAELEKDDSLKLAENYAYLGDIYLGLNEFTKAFRYFKKAILLDNEHPHYHYLMGFTFAQVKRWALAKSCFFRAHRLEKDNAEYMRGLGWTLVMLGEREEGEALLQRALKKDPNSVWALVDLGYSYYRRGAYQDAIPLFEEAILRDSSLTELRDVLTTCREKVGTRTSLATPALSRSVEQISGDVEAIIRRKLPKSPHRHHLGVVRNGIKMWTDYLAASSPKYLFGASGWAAAIEYLMIQVERNERPALESLCSRYGVGSAELLKKCRLICDTLQVATEDARYLSKLRVV